MFISVLYVGPDCPEDWIKIDAHARMSVLEFEEFQVFASTHSGKIYAVPELAGADYDAWNRWLIRAKLRAPLSFGGCI
jgi:hypothetical protein